MEHVNNDMDDLFRKAGELYPLKTSESDWDSVLGKLQEEITGESGSFSDMQMKGNQSRRRWLFLLLLIPLAFFSLVYFPNSGNKVLKNLRTDQAKTSQQQVSPQKIDHPVEATAIAQASTNQKNIISDETEKMVTDKVKYSDKNGAGSSQKNLPGSLLTHSPLNGSKNHDRIPARAEGSLLPAGFAATSSSLSSSGGNNDSHVIDPKMSGDPMKKFLSLTTVNTIKTPSVYGMPFPTLNTTPTPLNTNSGSTTSKPKAENKNSSKGIYAAIIGGPDLSTVAYQSTTQAGYSLGVLIGYQFNKRIAVETGLLWDKKYYYSNGAHFDKDAAQFPSSWDVLYLNGNCNMFEIPLNFRYNFATEVNHGFFAEAGLSSYLMKKEYYDYSYTSYNSPPHSRDSTYNKSSNYIFSVIQISAGYEHTIGRNTSIRIEPYLKIPLQGIGIGNMPITSAGLYIGISHNFR